MFENGILIIISIFNIINSSFIRQIMLTSYFLNTDLKQELSIHDTKSDITPQSPTKNIENIIDSNKLINEVETANRNRLRSK